MDASMMDAEGGRVHLLERRAKRLVVIVALQNLLVAACLLLTLYAYCAQEPESAEVSDNNNVHIHFTAIADVEDNTTLEFISVQRSYKIYLNEEKKDEFYINCTGPYVLYMDLCYVSMDGKNSSGTLWLLDGSKTPEILFSLSSSSAVCTPTGRQKLIYIRKSGMYSLFLNSRGSFKLKKATVGLSSLLGRCLY